MIDPNSPAYDPRLYEEAEEAVDDLEGLDWRDSVNAWFESPASGHAFRDWRTWAIVQELARRYNAAREE